MSEHTEVHHGTTELASVFKSVSEPLNIFGGEFGSIEPLTTISLLGFFQNIHKICVGMLYFQAHIGVDMQQGKQLVYAVVSTSGRQAI